MYFKFECTNCGKSLKVREENAGKKARCPYCDASITVPRMSLEDIPVARPRRRGADGASVSASVDAPVSTTYGEEQSDGTNVPLLRTAIYGAIATAIFFGAIWPSPVRDSYFGKLFIKDVTGSWVPYATVFLTAWAISILWLKRRKLKRQKASMLFDVLPNELSDDITTRTVDQFVGHIRSLPVKPADSFLINRVLRGLGHFKVRKSNPEVARMLASQSEIDSNAVDSSYTTVKVFIWAIPILGFIGTVIGISAAVAGFSGDIATGGGDVEDLKAKLAMITQGLGVAFDTTLIALVLSMIVSFPASTLQKAEEDLLNWVDEYCNENLLKRLNDGDRPDIDTNADLPTQIRQAIDAAMNGNHGTLLRQVDEMSTRMAKLQTEQVERLGSAMDGLSDRTEAAQQDVAASMLETANSLQTYFGGLERGLASLNSVLERLGEKRIVIETHAPEKKPGFFASLFHRRNGVTKPNAAKPPMAHPIARSARSTPRSPKEEAPVEAAADE